MILINRTGRASLLLLLFLTTFQIHPPLSTTNWEVYDPSHDDYYYDRYTSRGTTKKSTIVPANQSKKSADDDDTIDNDDNHDDVPDDRISFIMSRAVSILFIECRGLY